MDRSLRALQAQASGFHYGSLLFPQSASGTAARGQRRASMPVVSPESAGQALTSRFARVGLPYCANGVGGVARSRSVDRHHQHRPRRATAAQLGLGGGEFQAVEGFGRRLCRRPGGCGAGTLSKRKRGWNASFTLLHLTPEGETSETVVIDAQGKHMRTPQRDLNFRLRETIGIGAR